MKHFFVVFCFSIFISLEFFSCRKETSSKIDLGYNYFPNQVGKYVIYNVDSLYYDDRFNPSKIDTFKFQLKEKIESIYLDNGGQPAMRLERYVKYISPNSSMMWKLRDVWTQNRTSRTAEKVEENTRYVKLVFPLTQKQTWSGNAQNINNEEIYSYNFFDLPRKVGDFQFDSVLEVDQHDETNLILKKLYIERYARNIGLIYKRVIDIKSQPNGVPDSLLSAFYHQNIMERIDSGINYTMTIISFGIE